MKSFKQIHSSNETFKGHFLPGGLCASISLSYSAWSLWSPLWTSQIQIKLCHSDSDPPCLFTDHRRKTECLTRLQGPPRCSWSPLPGSSPAVPWAYHLLPLTVTMQSTPRLQSVPRLCVYSTAFLSVKSFTPLPISPSIAHTSLSFKTTLPHSLSSRLLWAAPNRFCHYFWVPPSPYNFLRPLLEHFPQNTYLSLSEFSPYKCSLCTFAKILAPITV